MSEWELPKGVETQSIERVGGGFAWESGVYDATVKMVYINESVDTGSVSFNIILENSAGKELKESFWIRSGKEKGNKITYISKKTGKEHPLPGYASANSMCVAVTGESLPKCMDAAEKKTINIYNPDLKKEAPTERDVLMGLVNKPVKVAVHQVIEDKQTKNNKGEYVSSGESRTVNQCKFFGNMAGKTTEEIIGKENAAKFDKWAEKNTGLVIDKSTTSKNGKSAAAIMGSVPADVATGSLFTN